MAGGADGGGRARLFPAARPLPTLSSPCRCAGRPPGRMERAANGAIVAPLPPDATKAARRAGDGCRSRHPDDPQASPARRNIARQGRYDGHQRVLGGGRARRRDAADVSPLRWRALTRQGRCDSHQRVRGRCHAWRQDAPNTSRWRRRAGEVGGTERRQTLRRVRRCQKGTITARRCRSPSTASRRGESRSANMRRDAAALIPAHRVLARPDGLNPATHLCGSG